MKIFHSKWLKQNKHDFIANKILRSSSVVSKTKQQKTTKKLVIVNIYSSSSKSNITMMSVLCAGSKNGIGEREKIKSLKVK